MQAKQIDMFDEVTIDRCPSLAKTQRLAGEWARHEYQGEPLSPRRAAIMAGELMAIEVAYRTNAHIPKDWNKAHPSYRYQMAALSDRISASSMVAQANDLPIVWVEPK
jgi:hypothetical protein